MRDSNPAVCVLIIYSFARVEISRLACNTNTQLRTFEECIHFEEFYIMRKFLCKRLFFFRTSANEEVGKGISLASSALAR